MVILVAESLVLVFGNQDVRHVSLLLLVSHAVVEVGSDTSKNGVFSAAVIVNGISSVIAVASSEVSKEVPKPKVLNVIRTVGHTVPLRKGIVVVVFEIASLALVRGASCVTRTTIVVAVSTLHSRKTNV